jgi:hypothetical protein
MLLLDTALLNVIERVCRGFQALTGRTNVWLAFQLTNLSVVVYFIWAALFFWNRDTGTRIFVGLFCGAVIWGLTQTIFKVPVETYELNAYRRVSQGLRNPRRVRDALLRVSFLTFAILLPFVVGRQAASLSLDVRILSYSLVVLTTVVLYLLACDPLPPCQGRVFEWMRRGRPVRSQPASSPLECGTSQRAHGLPAEAVARGLSSRS